MFANENKSFPNETEKIENKKLTYNKNYTKIYLIMSGFLTPPPFKPEMAKEKIDSTYKNYRWQVFLGIFIGYAGFYIVRKNFSRLSRRWRRLALKKASLVSFFR